MSSNIAMKNKIIASERLPSPKEIFQELPVTDEIQSAIQGWRQEIADIFKGRAKKLLVIVGPCSIHNEASALEYAEFLKVTQKEFREEIFLVMRTYFEKPRTNIGWKGLISDPHLNETYDIAEGLRLARKILLRINKMGVPTATEFLEIITAQYLCDLVSWGAIGARTVESQLHRELASFLAMPVGFKNSTSGDIMTAIESIRTAQGKHNFLSVDKDGFVSVFKTQGNDACHLVLRGGREKTNYDRESIKKAAMLLKKNSLTPRVIVDCSHGNSQKKYMQQIKVFNAVAKQVAAGSRYIAGVMLESHILGGCQQFVAGQEMEYNRSITDACLSLEETYALLARLAAAVGKC